MINYKTYEEIANNLANERSVAVMCHVRPDGDAVGSAVALSLALNRLGIKSGVFCADDIPAKFSFLPLAKIINKEFFGEYSAICAVDCGDLGRLGDYGEIFKGHKNTYNIDHHISNTKFAKRNYVNPKNSNSENIFDIVKYLKVDIDKDMANFLLMGIMTDTGGFRHKGVTSSTYYTAGSLLEAGGQVTEIYYNCFSKQTKARAKLFATVISKLRYLLEDKFAVAVISRADIALAGANPAETEGFIDFIMGVDCVEVGACIMEMEKNKYKISLRAKDTDVNAVAMTFGGGGHKLASGCQINGEIEEVIDKLRYAVKVNIKE